MTDELREAFKVLDKYEYEGMYGYWYPFTSIEEYGDSDIRLKPLPLKPLTVEEAEKLKYVYMPYIRFSGASYFKSFDGNKVNYVKTGLAYATPEEATRHAQGWIDDAKEKAGL